MCIAQISNEGFTGSFKTIIVNNLHVCYMDKRFSPFSCKFFRNYVLHRLPTEKIELLRSIHEASHL